MYLCGVCNATEKDCKAWGKCVNNLGRGNGCACHVGHVEYATHNKSTHGVSPILKMGKCLDMHIVYIPLYFFSSSVTPHATSQYPWSKTTGAESRRLHSRRSHVAPPFSR